VGNIVVARSVDNRLANRLPGRLVLRTLSAVRRLYRRSEGRVRVTAETRSAAVHFRREHDEYESMRQLSDFVVVWRPRPVLIAVVVITLPVPCPRCLN